MKDRLKLWEVALMLSTLVLFTTGVWIDSEQEALAGQMIRLHVIANSDTPQDQALKLEVRDRILTQAQTWYESGMSLSDAAERFQSELPKLEQIGEWVVHQHGYSYPVSAELTQCWFPSKEYDNFSLPAGEYTALRIVIGEGEGQNWWCVAFPPLCVGAASQSVEDATEAGYFLPEQAGLMQQEEGYILKFRTMELLGQLKQKINDG